MQAEEKFFLNLEKAKNHLKMADHLTYITYPIIKENKLLLKVIEELSLAITNTINAILQYEYAYKRIALYKDAKENFRTFKKLAPKYSLNKEQLDNIIKILVIAEKHRKSPLEFSKKDKIVIMSDNSKIEALTLDQIKNFILEAKDFLRKCSLKIKK